MRFNDGAVDSHGRFWAGAMNDPKIQPPGPEGVLLRLDPDLSVHRMLAPVTIPNGIGWNWQDDTMYLTDSPTAKIFAFDFDAATGAISNRRVHFDFGEPLEPDGFAIDVDGCIWSAIHGLAATRLVVVGNPLHFDCHFRELHQRAVEGSPSLRTVPISSLECPDAGNETAVEVARRAEAAGAAWPGPDLR